MTWLAETARLSYGWRRFLLLVAAGAIAALSVPPLFILPALFVGMPILVWCLDGAERLRGIRAFFSPAFFIGFSFGLGSFVVALHSHRPSLDGKPAQRNQRFPHLQFVIRQRYVGT